MRMRTGRERPMRTGPQFVGRAPQAGRRCFLFLMISYYYYSASLSLFHVYFDPGLSVLIVFLLCFYCVFGGGATGVFDLRFWPLLFPLPSGSMIGSCSGSRADKPSRLLTFTFLVSVGSTHLLSTACTLRVPDRSCTLGSTGVWIGTVHHSQ